MMLTTRAFAGFVLAASTVVLGAALLSQYWGGLMPCELCLLQRWPWSIAIVVAIVAVLAGSRSALPWLAMMLAAIFAVSAILGFYHVGVEQHWFAGPSACTVNAAGPTTLEELRRQLLATQPVLCDQVQWSLFGVSLAGWNLLASAVMAVLCTAVFVRARRTAGGRPVPQVSRGAA
jgi:disulfide bond formation protein DsbB